jgi:hypothetical protein
MRQRHRMVHGLVWALLAVALPGMLALALLAVPDRTQQTPAIRLQPPQLGQ